MSPALELDASCIKDVRYFLSFLGTGLCVHVPNALRGLFHRRARAHVRVPLWPLKLVHQVHATRLAP